MGINITQFAPPGTVSKLVWDDDMKPGVGKVFKGDLTGNVTGNVTGDVTGDLTGNCNGYLKRVCDINSTSGTKIISAASVTGFNTIQVPIAGNGYNMILDDIFLVDYPNPCNVYISSGNPGDPPPTISSYDANDVVIQTINGPGYLNIYGAVRISMAGNRNNSGTYNTVSISDIYVRAGGLITPL